MTRSRKTLPRLFTILNLVALTFPAQADTNPGSHQHGHGLLQVAIEGSNLDIHFQAPAASLTGFEYAPANPEQKKQVTDTVTWLQQTPLAGWAGTECQVTRVSVLSSQPQHETDHQHHEHHRPDHHSDYEISQTVTCSKTGERLHSSLPERFQHMETLRLEWVGQGGQGSATLNRNTPGIAISPE